MPGPWPATDPALPGRWTAPAAAAEIDQVVGQPAHRRRIDHVFVGSAHAHPQAWARIVAAQLVGDGPVDGVWLSDHAGVLVGLDVEAARAS
jgi:endonuclease/exonuclease/phosphatase family metal-dependent hydrolase